MKMCVVLREHVFVDAKITPYLLMMSDFSFKRKEIATASLERDWLNTNSDMGTTQRSALLIIIYCLSCRGVRCSTQYIRLSHCLLQWIINRLKVHELNFLLCNKSHVSIFVVISLSLFYAHITTNV